VRSVFLLVGFALGGAVMVVLLSVGEAILEQARDKDLLGGGDVVLLPVGVDVEAMKIGGLSAMFFRIPNARYAVASLLEGQRYEGEIDAASPLLSNRLLYLGPGEGRPPRAVLASAGIPSRERRMLGEKALPWDDSDASRAYLTLPPRATPLMDAFHLPDTTAALDSLWAEWHYFNLRRGEGDPYGYVTLMLAGDVARGRGRGIAIVQWREPGGRTFRETEEWPQAKTRMSLATPDLTIGPCSVRLEDGAYVVRGGAGEIEFDFRVVPTEGYYYPPFALDPGGRLSLGYVIPVLRGDVSGTIRAGGRSYTLDGYAGYKDHNWGFWDEVHWDWGQAIGHDTAIFYGGVRWVRGPRDLDSAVFLAVLNRRGLVQIFRINGIERRGTFPGDARRTEPSAAGVPAVLSMTGATGPDSIRVTIEALDAVATPLGREGAGGFVQILGRYTVEGMIDGNPVALREVGFSEVFVR
jgi:hypothetical protein